MAFSTSHLTNFVFKVFYRIAAGRIDLPTSRGMTCWYTGLL